LALTATAPLAYRVFADRELGTPLHGGGETDKSFLVLFFKKEHLPCLPLRAHEGAAIGSEKPVLGLMCRMRRDASKMRVKRRNSSMPTVLALMVAAGRKVFFFEKKKQKTFAALARSGRQRGAK
jgi:hypothetical protein